MVGLDHGAAESPEEENLAISARNSHYGLILFAIYFAVYAAFVLLTAFRPDLMAQKPWAGINLAVWYGFGLIVAALLLALLYGWLCRASATIAEPKERP